MRRTVLITLAAIVLPAGLAVAADKPSTSKLMDELASCRAIAGATERLACFDAASDKVITARKKGDLLVLDRGVVVERKKARFGLALTDGAVFGGGVEDQATEVKEVETTVKEVGEASYGRYHIAMANGMVWETTEPVRYTPKIGAKAVLSTGLLGAFKLKTDGLIVKVKRVR